jgi:iron(III) transport system permease protein
MTTPIDTTGWPQAGAFFRLRARWAERLTLTNLVLLACTLIVAWLVLVPVAALFYVAFTEQTMYGPGAFTFDNFVEAYGSLNISRLFGNSLIYAVGASLLSFALGALIAWVVERTDSPFRGLFHNLAIVSFAVPGLLIAMAWTLILSPNIGWVNAELQGWFGLTNAPFNIYTMTGMIWALASHSFPLAYMLMGPAFRVLDIRMEEAAVVAGATNFNVASRVTFPLLRPAMLSTLLLLFIRGIESFEVPRIIGMPARINVFTTEIQDAASSVPPELGSAASLSMVLLVLCMISIYFYRRATRNADAYATIGAKGYVATEVKLGKWRWPIGIFTALLFAVMLGLPLFTLLWQSFFHNVAPPSIARLTTANWDNYRYLFTYPVFREAAFDSVALGAMAATIVCLLMFVLAWISQRAKLRFGWLIDGLAFAPIAIPSVIVGAAVLFAYLILPIPVYDTIWILLIAYVTLFMPYGMRFASGGLAQIHRELEEVAEISGANLFQTFRRVLLPLLAPVLIACWLYVFVLCIRELAASIFLAGASTHVLGTVSLTLWEGGGSLGAVCALGVVEVIPLVIIVGIMRRLEQAIRVNN